MRGKSFCLLALAVFFIATMPVTNAQSAGTGQEGLNNPTKPTPTTLYFHIFDTFNAFPINTQTPQPDGNFKVGGTNFPTIVVPQTAGTPAELNYDFNTIYGFATSGPVEYNFIENGQPRFHPERGIARDVTISQDPSYVPYAHIFVSIRDAIGTHQSDVLPRFTVRVQMKEGNVVGPDSNLDLGNPIMHGQLTAYLWNGGGQAPPQDSVSDPTCTDGPVSGQCPVLWAPDGIVEYKIPLTIDHPVIPKVNAYNVRVDWYQNPTGDSSQDDKFAEGYMRLVSDDKHHPRLTMAITNPVYITFIHPEVAAGILLIHTAENSPWGTYDIDVANMTISVTGPSTPQDLPVVVAQNSHVHNLHDKDAEVTYLWRFRDEGAQSGDYKIHVTVRNLNHTAMATGDASFHVDDKSAYGVSDQGQVVTNTITESGGKSSPGASLLVVVVLLAGTVLARRRKA